VCVSVCVCVCVFDRSEEAIKDVVSAQLANAE